MGEDGLSIPGTDTVDGDLDSSELLMEATVHVLAEEGVQGLTLRKVAERAGKNRGLVHYYFDSKDDLLASLLDHILNGTKRLIGIENAQTSVEKLWTALRFHAYGPGGIDDAGRHYYLAMLQLQALAAHDPDVRERFTRNHRFVVNLIASIIEDGIDDGSFQPVDPEPTALYLVSTIDGARSLDLSTVNESAVDEPTIDEPAIDASARETVLAFLEVFVADSLVR